MSSQLYANDPYYYKYLKYKNKYFKLRNILGGTDTSMPVPVPTAEIVIPSSLPPPQYNANYGDKLPTKCSERHADNCALDSLCRMSNNGICESVSMGMLERARQKAKEASIALANKAKDVGKIVAAQAKEVGTALAAEAKVVGAQFAEEAKVVGKEFAVKAKKAGIEALHEAQKEGINALKSAASAALKK